MVPLWEAYMIFLVAIHVIPALLVLAYVAIEAYHTIHSFTMHHHLHITRTRVEYRKPAA